MCTKPFQSRVLLIYIFLIVFGAVFAFLQFSLYVTARVETVKSQEKTVGKTMITTEVFGCRIDDNCYDENECTFDICQHNTCVYLPDDGVPCKTLDNGQNGFCSEKECVFAGYDKPHGGHYPTVFHVLARAGTDVPDQILTFPNNHQKGKEGIGLITNPEPGQDTVDVISVSVDSLLETYNMKRIDILSIDTEGNDPAVLYGSRNALKYVRYLEFENFNVGLWKTTNVSEVIAYLDNISFDCFWAGHNRLWPITIAWVEDYDTFKEWSNIVCGKRGDVWLKVLYTFVENTMSSVD